MSAIRLTLPDGSEKQVERGTTVLQVAEQIGKRLAQAAVAGKLDGKLVDLSTPIEQDAQFAVITFDSPEGPDVYWHSAAHVMADAVVRLFPKTKLTIGPPVDEGFYYDFDVEEPFTPEFLLKVEREMQSIVKK